QFGVKNNIVKLYVAKKSGITGSNRLNKLAYELSKTYNEKNVDKKFTEAYDKTTNSINETITIYKKGKNVADKNGIKWMK
ncbi:MAG: hypothetical protein ACLTK8_07980, partial [Paeniclostridium sp.]